VLEVKRTNRFKKEFALAEKRGRDMRKIIEVMGIIINEQPLPERCRPHPLRGKWEGCIDCHVLNDDWVLIYEIDKAAGTVTFHRTGSHADLF
jgi:mRNA interferase YafQ